MKTLITILTLSLLTSCGKVLSPDELLNPMQDYSKDGRVESLEERVAKLEQRLDNAYKSLDSLTSSINNLDINQDTLEQSISLNLSRIIDLELALGEQGETVAEIIDPCGDNVGQFDEVLIRLSNGGMIGYFEQGNKRFLTSLPNGNFRTTDKQACSFSIVNGNYEEN